jgi:hypothetical protein
LFERVATPHGDVELVWQPPDAPPTAGVLFLAHGAGAARARLRVPLALTRSRFSALLLGCSHSAGDFWPADAPGCDGHCLGLPEERRITEAALAARLFVVAASSADRALKRCWWPATDGPRVASALTTLLQREGVIDAPLFALGASSGGAFVTQLPFFVANVSALCVQIMGAAPESLLPRAGASFPPSRWVHMPRDAAMASFVASALTALQSAEQTAEEARVAPQRVTPDFLASRVPSIDANASAAVAAALQAAGLLDAEGFLRADPRRSDWRAALQGLPAGTLRSDTLAADASPIAEELNVAWAQHEIVSDGINDTLAFFKRHARPRSSSGSGEAGGEAGGSSSGNATVV